MSVALRLSDILARELGLEWFEAVALVCEVADRVRDSVSGRGVPELDQVELNSDGRVSLTGTVRTDEPVRRLGQLLQACLVQADPPVQLRLVAEQATAPEPPYGSIREFSEALAYFERPDRAGLLRALHARLSALPLQPLKSTPTLDAIAPLKTAPPATEKPEPRRRPTLRWQQAALGTLAIVVLAATALYVQTTADNSLPSEVSELAVKTSDVVGTTLVKGLSAVTETVGLGRLAPANSTAPPPASAPPLPKPSGRSRPKPPATPALTPPAFRVLDLEAPPQIGALEEPEIVKEPATSIVPPDDAPATVERVYSSADQDVDEPIGVRPQLPRVLPQDVDPQQLSQIELLVLADGTVGSVKLVGGRRSVLEGMLLSAAKAWTFRPAVKEGRPVAYRKTVWLIRE